MYYDAEADWILLNGCNYRCDYCFWSPESLGSKISGLARAQRWAEAFNDTGKIWLLHITGGEPSLHPEFAELCARLAERHHFSLNSNFSRPSVADMARRVDPARVSLLHAAMHPEERARRHGWSAFAANVEAAATAGHRLIISVVATPEVLGDFDRVAKQAGTLGFRPVPKMLRSHWRGSLYPDAYTAEERAIFAEVHRWAREGYAALIDDPTERPTVWPLDDDQTIEGSIDFRGRVCDAGRAFVTVHPDGRAYSCGTSGFLGNLLDGDLAMNDRPVICDTSYCFYFCRKYSYRPYLAGAAPPRTAAVS